METPRQKDAHPMSLRRAFRVLTNTQGLDTVAAEREEYQAAVLAYSESYNRWYQAGLSRVGARDAQRRAAVALDDQFRLLGMVLIGIDSGRRDSPQLMRYFRGGYGSALRREVANSVGFASGLLSGLETEPHPEIAARSAPLAAARAALQEAERDRMAAEAALSDAWYGLRSAQLQWILALSKYYFALRTHFPYQRKWIERLVSVRRRWRKGTKKVV